MNTQTSIAVNKLSKIRETEITRLDRSTDHHCSSAQSAAQTEQILRFGPFRLDRVNAVLTRDHEQLTLTPKAFALLSYLVESGRQLLTKDDIFSQVWPNVIVSDGALSVCIGEIRKVLGDSSKKPCYIETVHKRGFRFIGATSGYSAHTSPPVHSIIKQPSTATIVGRDKPVALMQQCLQKALAASRQMVFVTGEPGIGKTTLVEEFIKHNLDTRYTWIAKGQCIEHYGSGEAYLPLLDALSNLAKKAGLELAEILGHYAPTWLEHLPALNGMIDPPPSREPLADVRPERMLRELIGALEAIAEDRLLVLILEDLHWSDHATIDLLSFLVRRDSPVRLLIVATFRSVDAAIHKHPVKNLKQELQLKRLCTSIPLEFLEQTHIAAYLSEVFPGHDFPEQFIDMVFQQSDGNPLFMVNLLKYLQNTDFLQNIDGQWQLTDELSTLICYIPDDIELMINQQAEQLSPKCLNFLEVASIASEPGGIAVQFTLTEVAAALDLDELDVEPCLDRLARNGHFLHTLGVTEWPDGSFSSYYEFTHALYQNVLYARVCTARKAHLHRKLGLRLELGYGTRSLEIANKLAVHFELGRDYFRAVKYLKQVAGTAASRGANREAIYALKKSQQLLVKLPQTVERDRLELSLLLLLAPAITASQGNATPEIEISYLRARELCQQLDQKSEQFRVLFGLRSFYLICGDLDKAHQLAQSLLALAAELNDSSLLLEAHVGLASSEWFKGNLQASHQHALQGIALYDQESHASHAALYGLDPGVFCHARAGQTLWPQGYPDQALEYEQQAVELAETLDHPYSLVFALLNRVLVHLYRCEGVAALASAEQAKAMAVQHGFSFLIAWSYYVSAWAFALVGDHHNARAEIKQALAVERAKSPVADSYLAVFLAETYLLLGDFDNGLSCLTTPCREHSYDTQRLYLQAKLLLLSDDSEKTSKQAEVLLKKAQQTSRQQGLRGYELRAAISLSKLFLHDKRNHDACQCLNNITRWFRQGHDTLELQEAYQLLEQLDKKSNNNRQDSGVEVAYDHSADMNAAGYRLCRDSYSASS